MEEQLNICKSVNIMHHINTLKNSNHKTLTIDTEKTFDKIQNLFMIDLSKKLVIEEICLNLIKDTYDKLIGNIRY